MWFLEPFTAAKQVIETLRRMTRRWDSKLKDDESVALRWIMAEGVSVLTLNLVMIAGLSLTLEWQLYSQFVSDRLAESLISIVQMRRISDSIDKYVNGVLSAANVPADVRTNVIGAFLPEPPDWAEPLAEMTWRMGRSAIQARSPARSTSWSTSGSPAAARRPSGQPAASAWNARTPLGSATSSPRSYAAAARVRT